MWLDKILFILSMSKLRPRQLPLLLMLQLHQSDSKLAHISMLNLQEISHQDSIKWELLDAIMKAIQLTVNTKAKEELLSLPELT